MRFPVEEASQDASLQAWDAADEYLVNFANEQLLSNASTTKKILVLNDSFGAISLSFPTHQVFSVSDSTISQQGLLYNQHQNDLTESNITLLTSMQALPSDIDLVLFKIPKSNALLIEQLIKIHAICTENTIVTAAARVKEIHNSTLKLFETYLGETTTSLAVKKARLVFVKPQVKTQKSPFPTVWPLENSPFTISNHANVFAREKLDIGARFFRQHLPKVSESSEVIDLGCGNGVIGLSILAQQPKAKVMFIDESFMAVASAQQNVSDNLAQCVDNCSFKANDSLTGVASNTADYILCNPPFHQLHAVTDHIAWQMFNDSYRVLKKGGELRIIGNRQLGYHVKLKRIFRNCHTIASNNKFVILSAIK